MHLSVISPIRTTKKPRVPRRTVSAMPRRRPPRRRSLRRTCWKTAKRTARPRVTKSRALPRRTCRPSSTPAARKRKRKRRLRPPQRPRLKMLLHPSRTPRPTTMAGRPCNTRSAGPRPTLPRPKCVVRHVLRLRMGRGGLLVRAMSPVRCRLWHGSARGPCRYGERNSKDCNLELTHSSRLTEIIRLAFLSGVLYRDAMVGRSHEVVYKWMPHARLVSTAVS
ncbi:hypothetical protein H310_02051 [Aphanomyces invadans]|uniref:Uncharacterized protein n=1 Tax=Aphanomyces invadans TaxID=157072 RepID=A0A024UMN4_9STRA|nr:hypothetical protein H310_02051 [Aphanomyces invadans]ETW07564.1 hypothetical protein H310_02051 [Aphanomyces invadans]|eukprot:XP_008863657.1 hypothetical protein H310_02051 [Aphanomyces invadans]